MRHSTQIRFKNLIFILKNPYFLNTHLSSKIIKLGVKFIN